MKALKPILLLLCCAVFGAAQAGSNSGVISAAVSGMASPANFNSTNSVELPGVGPGLQVVTINVPVGITATLHIWYRDPITQVSYQVPDGLIQLAQATPLTYGAIASNTAATYTITCYPGDYWVYCTVFGSNPAGASLSMSSGPGAMNALPVTSYGYYNTTPSSAVSSGWNPFATSAWGDLFVASDPNNPFSSVLSYNSAAWSLANAPAFSYGSTGASAWNSTTWNSSTAPGNGAFTVSGATVTIGDTYSAGTGVAVYIVGSGSGVIYAIVIGAPGSSGTLTKVSGAAGDSTSITYTVYSSGGGLLKINPIAGWGTVVVTTTNSSTTGTPAFTAFAGDGSGVPYPVDVKVTSTSGSFIPAGTPYAYSTTANTSYAIKVGAWNTLYINPSTAPTGGTVTVSYALTADPYNGNLIGPIQTAPTTSWVAVTLNTSTTLLQAGHYNTVTIANGGSGAILINLSGATLTGAAMGSGNPGISLAAGASWSSPPGWTGTSAITGYTGTTGGVSVTYG